MLGLALRLARLVTGDLALVLLELPGRLILVCVVHETLSLRSIAVFSRPHSLENHRYALRVEPLRDSWGREIKSVRVSVTDKCNFRCRYCMPAEGLEWLQRDEVLSFEEIARLVGVLARLGVDEVRLTGGEPLVRRDLPVLVGCSPQTPTACATSR